MKVLDFWRIRRLGEKLGRGQKLTVYVSRGADLLGYSNVFLVDGKMLIHAESSGCSLFTSCVRRVSLRPDHLLVLTENSDYRLYVRPEDCISAEN